MCFSTSVSFGAGLILSITGVATLQNTRSRSMLAFAFIPLIFGSQQIAEGFLWICLKNPGYQPWEWIPTNIFLFLSHFIWPIWMPLSCLLLEKNAGRKRKLFMLLFLGCVLAAYHLFFIIINIPTGEISSYHIVYKIGYPAKLFWYSSSLYGITTILPSFISTLKHMWLLGVVLIVAYLVSWFLYTDYLVSVFCFFAAILSVVVYHILRIANNKERLHYA